MNNAITHPCTTMSHGTFDKKFSFSTVAANAISGLKFDRIPTFYINSRNSPHLSLARQKFPDSRMVEVYVHDNKDTPENFTDAHNSGIPVGLPELEKIGVIYKCITNDDDLNKLATERNYKNRDQITLNLNTFKGDLGAFNAKMANFYKEHYHEDEEIRYIVSGEGYFDVRSKDDTWIRTRLVANDLLILPAGIYHRFTLTSDKKEVCAVRLFKDEPKWEAINRDTGKLTEARSEYAKTIAV